MSWVTIIWSMAAAACLTLAAVHVVIWCKARAARPNLMFAVMASLVAVFGMFELLLMRAHTPAEYAGLHRWGHVSGGLLLVALLGFVRLFFGAGRVWLFWLVVGLCGLILVLNFVSPASFNFKDFTSLRQFEFLGEIVAVPEGIPTRWARLGEGSLLLAAVFVADAAISLWRRGDARERRHAVFVGGGVLACMGLAMVNAILIHSGLYPVPYCVSLFFVLVVLAMAYELGHDLIHAGEIARDLRESEQRMDLAATAANLGLWSWDMVSEEVWATQKARQIFGLGPSERLDFSRFLQCLHPDDRATVTHAVAKAMNGEGEFEAEYRVVVPGRPTHWISARGRVEFNSQRKPKRMMGVSIDITGRKRNEDALRESEARFRTVADNAPVMIWMSGPDKLCSFFNKGWLDFTGRTLEQEQGNGWAEGVHPDDLAGCLKRYVDSFEARRPFILEYRLRRHDGEYRWISDNGVPRYDNEGNFLGYIGSCVDITERKRADERFRLAVEASPSAILMVNSLGRILLTNALTEKLFGYRTEELIGESMEVLVPERLRDAHPGHRAEFFAEPQARPMGAGRELFARHKDGSEFPVEIGLNPIHTEEGVLVLCAITDITERRRAEIEADQQRAELAHLSRVTTVSELSGSMAHELNQPLAIILSNAQAAQRLLAQEPPDLAEVRDILMDIVSEDRRAGEVIHRLRSLLKRGESRFQRLSVNEIIEEVLRLSSSDLLGRSISVHRALSGSLPQVLGDRIQLQQVLLNLVINAFDAMAVKPPAGRHLSLATAHSNGAVRVSVSDTGCGLPPDVDRVFMPFYTTKKEGLGLGLGICRSIVTAHKGRLWAEPRKPAETTPGAETQSHGATFHVELPAAQEGKP